MAIQQKIRIQFKAFDHRLLDQSVEDIVETTGDIADGGGTVWVDNQEIPGIGAFSVASDRTGAAFAIWKQIKTP